MREVRAASLIGFIEVSYYAGLDPFKLFRKAKISPSLLDDPENRHAARPVIDMIENAAAQSGCEAFGLLMAECRPFSSLGPLSLLLQHLETIGEILDALNEYRRTLERCCFARVHQRRGFERILLGGCARLRELRRRSI